MPNRVQRRYETKKQRKSLKRLKLRCICCERFGRTISKEHYFPVWLIEHCNIAPRGINWLGERGVNPAKATIPLCKECNEELGKKVEAPVSVALPDVEQGRGLSDREAELLVRWLWKFEGMQWHLNDYTRSGATYSAKWTLRERVLDADAFKIRPILTLGVGLIDPKDPEFDDWPMGLDSPPAPVNSIFVSGVFGRTALMVSVTDFEHLIPAEFSKYSFGDEPADRDSKVFFPECRFKSQSDAVGITISASIPLLVEHEGFVSDTQNRTVHVVRNEIILP